MNPTDNEVYIEYLERISTNAIREAVRIIESNELYAEFPEYFSSTMEIAVSATKLGYEEHNTALKYFPLTVAFLSGIMFAGMQKQEAVDLLSKMSTTEFAVAKVFYDIEVECHKLVSDYLAVKEELKDTLTNDAECANINTDDEWDEQIKRDSQDPDSPIHRLIEEAKEEYDQGLTKEI